MQLALGGLLFGLAIALGEANPPTQFNYDLTFTTIEGLTVPLEPIIAAVKTVGLLVGITGSFMLVVLPATGARRVADSANRAAPALCPLACCLRVEWWGIRYLPPKGPARESPKTCPPGYRHY